MNTNSHSHSHAKTVVCGVALVALSTIRPAPASAQVTSGACGSGFVPTGAVAFCVLFDPSAPQPVTQRVDFPGGHSFKAIVNVRKAFFLQIVSTPISPPGPTARYPDPAEYCIPYVGATSDTTLGTCARYDVTAFDAKTGGVILQGDESSYVVFPVHYRVAWNNPTLANPTYDNPRMLRAQLSSSLFFDRTDAVLPNLQAGKDPGVDDCAPGMSQYLLVDEPHSNSLVACLDPLDCSRPMDPTANVFQAGRTIPIKVVLSPPNAQADLRLSFSDASGTPKLANSSGNSNQDNMFRAAGNHFQFDWSTSGLAPGIYAVTISPGFTSGALFAPTTILVTLQ